MKTFGRSAAATVLIAVAACTHQARVKTEEVVKNPTHPLNAHKIAEEICGNVPSADLGVGLTIQGRILEVEEKTMCANDRRIVKLRVDDSGNSRVVYLAPVEYLQAQGLRLSAGDRVVVHASRLSKDDSIIVAQSVTKSGKATAFRDKNGYARWGARAH